MFFFSWLTLLNIYALDELHAELNSNNKIYKMQLRYASNMYNKARKCTDERGRERESKRERKIESEKEKKPLAYVVSNHLVHLLGRESVTLKT